jgi:hypothetical protein
MELRNSCTAAWRALASKALPLLLAAGVVFLSAVDLHAAEADAPKQPEARTYTPEQKAYMDTLDNLLAAQDYLKFREALAKANDGPHLSAALDWGRARTLEGGGMLVPLTYSALLWKAADMNPDYDFMRQTSDLMAMYGLLAAIADAPKCADKSAPEHHITSIVQGYKRQFQHTAKLPDKQRQIVLDTAVAMERKLAPRRVNDKYLCRFGLQEHIDTSKKYGNQAYEEVPKQPGQIGRQMVLRNDQDYVPKFLPREQWEKKQSEVRASFSELLAKILNNNAGK